MVLAAAAVWLAACHPQPSARPTTTPLPSPASPATPSPAETVTGSVAVPAPSVSPSPSPPSDPFALARSLRYASPDALASALARSETAIRSGAASGAELVALGHAEDAAYRQLVAQPEWQDAVLSRLPASLRPVAEANITAGSELKALANPRDELPAWRILAPRPQAELLADYREAQRLSGIPWEYLAAINLVETRMGRIRGLSAGGARGPMQFLPSTWARYGSGDIDNAHDSILAAGRLLAAHGAPADMAGALLAYNPSQHYVRAVTIYARQLQAEPRALGGYYNWQVYFRTLTRGEALLTEGYGS